MATKITCAASDCVFCNDKFRCTADKVQLAANDIMTMWDGRQRYNRCLTYQKSERAREIEKKLAALAQAVKDLSAKARARCAEREEPNENIRKN